MRNLELGCVVNLELSVSFLKGNRNVPLCKDRQIAQHPVMVPEDQLSSEEFI